MISIITPVYNVEKYLQRCIDSILSQSYTNFELILIDDGSTDSSGSICDAAAKADNRVNVFHRPNSGVSVARNLGLNHAKGEYICFVDSDDYLDVDYLQTLLGLLTKNNADIAMCNYQNVNAEGQVIDVPNKNYNFDLKSYSSAEIAKEVYGNHFVPYDVIWNKIYARKIWSSLRFTEKMHCEDDAIIQKVYHLADKIVYFDKPFYYYVRNEAGIMHTAKNAIPNIMDAMYGLFLHALFLNKNGETEVAQEAFHCYFADGVQVLTYLKQENTTSTLGEKITYKSFFHKFKLHYLEAKKVLNINFKRKLYYKVFFMCPDLVLKLRSLKNKQKK